MSFEKWQDCRKVVDGKTVGIVDRDERGTFWVVLSEPRTYVEYFKTEAEAIAAFTALTSR